MSLCLIAGAAVAALGAEEATLSWTHSVERVVWEEVWRDAPDGLHLVEARVQGSGAGMEPAPEAVLRDGFWRWRPELPAVEALTLRRSGATADWRLCAAGRCAPLGDFFPGDPDPVTLVRCP